MLVEVVFCRVILTVVGARVVGLIGYVDSNFVETVAGSHGLYNDCVINGLFVGRFNESVVTGLTGRLDLAGYVPINIGFGVVRYSFVNQRFAGVYGLTQSGRCTDINASVVGVLVVVTRLRLVHLLQVFWICLPRF